MAPDDSRGPSRRRLLRAGGVGLAGTLGSTAGCIATLPPLGRRVRYGRVDVPESGPPVYRRWLPAPSAFRNASDGEDDVGTPLYLRPGGLGEDVVGERFSFLTDLVLRRLDYFGIGFERYDWIVHFGPAFVAAADVDRSAVRDVLAPTGYEAAGPHGGYDLYGREDRPRAVAVGDSALVFVRGPGGVRDARAVVNAASGGTRRYHESDETFARLSEAAGTNPFTWFQHGRDDEYRSATSFTFDEGSVYYVWDRIYPEGETPTKAEIQRELEEDQPRAGIDPREAMDVDVEISGRVVTIENRQSHERFRESHDEEALAPQITWGLDHDRVAETVTLRYEAGEPIPADHLEVVYAPILHDGDEPRIEPQFADVYERVTPGDAITCDVSNWPVDTPPETDLRVIWNPPGEHEKRLLVYEYDESG